jgi:hypothetical protein
LTRGKSPFPIKVIDDPLESGLNCFFLPKNLSKEADFLKGIFIRSKDDFSCFRNPCWVFMEQGFMELADLPPRLYNFLAFISYAPKQISVLLGNRFIKLEDCW